MFSRRTKRHGARHASTVLAAVVCGVVLAAPLMVSGPAIGATDDETPQPTDTAPATPAPSPTPDGDTVRVLAAPNADLSIGPGDAVRLPLTITNDSATPVTDATAQAVISDEPLASANAAQEWISDGATIAASTVIGTAPIDEVAAGSGIDVTITADGTALEDRAAGAYAVRVELPTDDETYELRTVLVIGDDTQTPTTVIVPITAEPRREGLLSREEIAALTGVDGALTEVLDGVAGSTVVLAVDPAIPAAIRSLGSAAPSTAIEWLERLESTPNERFALQFGDADVAAQIAAGLTEPLTPGSLTSYQLPENFIPGAFTPTHAPAPTATPTETAAPATSGESAETTETSTPSPTPGQDGAVYPSAEQLFSFGEELAQIAWPIVGTASPEAIQTLADAGYRTLTPSTQTSEGADGGVAAANAPSALVYDEAISARLTDLVGTSEPAEISDGLAQAAADFWFASEALNDAPLLVALDRQTGDETRTAESLRRIVQTVTRGDTVTLSPLAPALDADADDNSVLDAPRRPDATRVDLVRSTLDRADAITRVATALRNPGLLTGQVRAELLQLTAVGWTADRMAWSDEVAAYDAALDERQNAISIQINESMTLAGAEAPLPVWVSNRLPWPIDITIHAEPEDARLNVQRRIETSVTADSNPRVQIPVQARVGNGDVTLTVGVFSRDGVPLAQEQTSTVTVRADWEVIGFWVIGLAVGGLIIGGIVRTVRSRRPQKKDATDE